MPMPDLCQAFIVFYIDGLVQDCSIPSALAMELLQSCTKLSIHMTDMYKSKYSYFVWILTIEWINKLK